MRYGEGVFIGYRYYEKKAVAPLFPFGFGLSYTQFRLDGLTLSSDSIGPGETVTATIQVTNVGARAGSTVVQFYVADEEASVSRPEKELAGFARCVSLPARRAGSASPSTCGASRSSTSRRRLGLRRLGVSRFLPASPAPTSQPRASFHADRDMDRRQPAPSRGEKQLGLPRTGNEDMTQAI